MEEHLPNPPIMPQSAQPPVYGTVAEPQPIPPVQPAPVKPKITFPDLKVVGIIFLVVMVIVVVSAVFTQKGQSQTAVAPTPTPTATTTPTAQQMLSPFATGSAFMNFDNSVTGFPGTLQNAVLLDNTLTPPVLDLPLGF